MGTSLPQVSALPQEGAEPPACPRDWPTSFTVIALCSCQALYRHHEISPVPRCSARNEISHSPPDKFRIIIGFVLFSVSHNDSADLSD